MIVGLDHVQVAVPAGRDDEIRAFYGVLLGLAELEKPAALRARGGAWFQVGVHELHLGVEAGFAPARKAHPAFSVDDLDALSATLATAGCEPEWDDAIPGVRRFFVHDPFGNRLELIEATA